LSHFATSIAPEGIFELTIMFSVINSTLDVGFAHSGNQELIQQDKKRLDTSSMPKKSGLIPPS